MTNLIDLDRALADFLEDGPNTAPEAPVVAALAHARTSPRRPDLIGWLRPDVMAPPSWRVFGLRPSLVLAGIALVVASLGVAVIGSRQPTVVPPGPSPTTLPSIAPTNAPFARQITMLVTAGQPYPIDVTDTTGDLVNAVSTQPGEGRSVGDGVHITSDPADRSALIVMWGGVPCESSGALRVDERTSRMTVESQACAGDTFPLDRIVRLTFRSEVSAAAWSGTVRVVGQPGASSPADSSLVPDTTHLELASTADSTVSIDIVDQSGHLAGAVSGPATASPSVEFVSASNVDPTTVRLVWPGSICDTVHRLTIAADFGLTVDRPNCQLGLDARERSVILTFDRAVDANALDTGLFSGRPGSGMPTWSLTGRDSVGGRYDLGIDDASASVINVAALDSSAVAGPSDRFRLDQAGQAVIELVWIGPGCATPPRLSIDATGSRWRLAAGTCDPAAPDVVRRISLKFDGSRSIDTIDFQQVAAGA